MLAAARRQVKGIVGGGAPGQRDGGEARLSAGDREPSAGVELVAAPLDLVALFRERRDPRVEGNGERDFLPDRRRPREADAVRGRGPRPRRHLAQDLPLRPRAGNAAPGDLGRKNDPPLRRCLRDAARDLVAGRRGEEQHGVRRLHEHGARERDVLVDAESRLHERRAATPGVRERL